MTLHDKFKNPYGDLEDDAVRRLNADVPVDDYKMVQRILTERGAMQTTVNILWQKLINELKRLGITDFTRADDFIRLVCDSKLVVPGEVETSGGGGSPAIRPDAETNGPTLGRGTPRPSGADSAVTNLGSDLPQRGGGRPTLQRRERKVETH